MSRKIRVGIDVGGTNTKAVAIDNETYEIVGVGIIPTTHDHELGVSQGVIDSFKKCLTENNISPDEVTFIAHSTTQATNALVEGDVAKVGVIAVSDGGIVGFLSKIQAKIKDIDLDEEGKRKITTAFRYINKKNFNEKNISDAIDSLISEGCGVIAASKTFGVDDIEEELLIKKIGKEKNIEVCAASEISKLYGLTRRTRTAVINGSILPRMIQTANSTESAVKSAGIKAPLMIMRGDGGVMDIEEMRNRPVLTMLSGPAASTVGALMYLKVSNGIFFEVGGTTTDIGVIKNGRPMIDYAVVGGQRTMVNSMDVHTVGVAGGSMIRANNGKIIKVGPRSCHIANLEYVVFNKPDLFDGAKIKQISPIKNDPEDYIVITANNGKDYALTTTCAANALGIIEEGDYSFGYVESAKKCFNLLGEFLNMSGKDAAQAVLDDAANTTNEVIYELMDKYKVEKSQTTIVGGGGGAKVLLPNASRKMDVKYKLADKAEIISSIGVALAMVRDVVERVIPQPTNDDIRLLRNEATDQVIKSGATAESVEIQIEIDQQTSKVRAIATGSTEIATQELSKHISDDEAKELVIDSFSDTKGEIKLEAKNDYFRVYTKEVNGKSELRAIDNKGFIKLQRADAKALKTSSASIRSLADKIWENLSVFKSDIKLNPDLYLCIGAKIADFEGLTSLEQLNMLIDSELSVRDTNEEVILIGAKNDL
ncbi:hydantoinase/oxoprolinase family protein [Anaerococcus sp. AGMB00486]|uniref:Hydantoinase/oxoprolinase family protein n=1 Tax=Anaerococcus faecalis TaxID=2742993 RepID=A0ABX2N6S9_9FIRM|nr:MULTISPECIES: hydantoinase/oxoprolinase family protein [Anaerococcus]MDY3005969.1 hydantoinase/oxoprolinase family protein [Anaerococcus porci]NVF10417.1 hydantoinase/oxoprolinase family protein [Anaerococcus faecalis]